MDLEFVMAVCRYYDIVKDKCESLLEYIQLSEQIEVNDKHGLYYYIRNKRITNYQYNNMNYIFHGCGCTVFNDDIIVADWDFGYKSLWCGIDSYKMALTLKNNDYSNTLFYDADYIEEKCELYAVQKDIILYKNQYYINLLNKGVMKTTFPACYDVLIIRYKGKKVRKIEGH